MIKQIIKWVSIVAGTVLLINVILIPFNIGLFVIKTASELSTKTYNADNIIHNYNWFYEYNAQFNIRTNQIKTYKSYLKDESDKKEQRRLRTELNGMQQACRNLVEKYNAASTKINTAVFKGDSLPSKLSINRCEQQ